MTMRAYRMLEWQQEPQMVDLAMPIPGPGEVRLRVAGNGLCQSDLHLIHDWTGCPPHLDISLPMTLGHEIGGFVDLAGPGVRGWESGQPVLVTLAGCGHCRECVQGWNNYCRAKPLQPGIGLDGGLADYVIAPVACLVPCDGLDPAKGAPLTDAGLSSYHAVRRVAPLLRPGTTVVIIGAGGLGHLAVAALKAVTSAQVVVVDPNADARGLALRSGADSAFEPGDAALGDISAMAVLDFVGSGDTIASAASMIRPLGHIVVVGRGAGSFALTHKALPFGAMLSTTFGGSKSELLELIALTGSGAMVPHVTCYPLANVATVLDQLAAGQIQGRAVIVP